MIWKPHIDGISAKLNKANAMISKVKHFAHQKTLKAIYHTIFKSHLYSSSLISAQNFNSKKILFILKKNHEDLCFYYKDIYILILSLKIVITLNSMIRLFLGAPFWNFWTVWMYFSGRTKLYGTNSVCIRAIFTWNYFQNLPKDIYFKI